MAIIIPQGKERERLIHRVILLIGFGMALSIFLSLTSLLYKDYQNNLNIAALAEGNVDLGLENTVLSELLDYVRTPQYKEKKAKEMLNLQKPGEIVVAIPAPPVEHESIADIEEYVIAYSNPQRWWNYFFGQR